MKYRFSKAINFIAYFSILYFILFYNPLKVDNILTSLFKINVDQLLLFKLFILVAFAFLFYFIKKICYSLYYGNLYDFNKFFIKFMYKNKIKFNTFILFLLFAIFVIGILIYYSSIINFIINYKYFYLYIILLFLLLLFIFIYIIISIVYLNIKLRNISKYLFTPFLNMIKKADNSLLSDMSLDERDRFYSLLCKQKKLIAFDVSLYSRVDTFIYLYSIKYIHNEHMDIDTLNNEFISITDMFNHRNFYITMISDLPLYRGEF